MAQEIGFSMSLRLPDDPVQAAELHEKFAAATRAFVAAIHLENAKTHVWIRQVRAPRAKRSPRLVTPPEAA
ncbi:MAG TPA: hypothetical protein VIY51_01795 [Xanthobacteraceae bacterium]